MKAVALISLLLSVLTAEASFFRDCGKEDATLHFHDAVSVPDPVHTGERQTVIKHGWTELDHGQDLTGEFSQFWCPMDCFNADGSPRWEMSLPWVRFIKAQLDVCKENSDMCPMKAGANFTATHLHSPLIKLTPHGWYRSHQVFHDSQKKEIGCADMIFEYVKAEGEEEAEEESESRETLLQ